MHPHESPRVSSPARAGSANLVHEPTASVARRVQFHAELAIDVSPDHQFELGNEIVFEEHSTGRLQRRAGAWPERPSRLTPGGSRTPAQERGRVELSETSNRGAA
jgi:hypothetical protein